MPPQARLNNAAYGSVRTVLYLPLIVALACVMLIRNPYNSYAQSTTVELAVAKTGAGSGQVISSPAGISCGVDCNDLYPLATMITLTATAATGSNFVGWQGGCSGATPTCQLTLAASSTVTATFALNQQLLTVTRAGNGVGRVASTPAGIDCGNDCAELYNYGALVALTANAAPGSTFAGWQGACSGAGTVCFVSVNAATNVTALFALNQYQLNVAKAGSGAGRVTSTPAGIDCGDHCTTTYLYGTVVTVTAVADPSSTFAGWVGACMGATTSCTVTVDAAQNITALFILNQYPLTVTKTGNGTGKVTSGLSGIDCGNSCSATYPHGTVVTLTAIPEASSTFSGWQGACTGITPTCTVTVDALKSVTASFTLKEYALSVIKAGSGSGSITSTPGGVDCGTVCGALYTHGTAVTLAAISAPNSLFIGWSGACTSANSTCTITLDAIKEVTAIFELKQYAVSVNKGGKGAGAVTSVPGAINCGSTCTAPYVHGTVVTLSAAAETTSLFTGWQGACPNTTDACVLTVDAAKSVTATFTLKQYALTVMKSGNGAGNVTALPAALDCGITCTQTLDHGAVVTLTTTAAPSSDFAGWQGACTGVEPVCVITMNEAKTVTASFTLKQYQLQVAKSGNGSGSVISTPAAIDCGLTCTQTFNHGTALTLTAQPESNTLFTGWQGACTGTAPTCALTLESSQAVTATFTRKQYALVVERSGNGSGSVVSIPGGLACGLTCTVLLDHGTVVTLTASADATSLFTGWTGDCMPASASCVITLTAAQQVTASFTRKQYDLTVRKAGNAPGTVTSIPAGLVCGPTCTLRLNHGTALTLTATAPISATFAGWQGACTGTAPVCPLMLEDAKAVTATFVLKQVDLMVTRGGNGAGVATSIPAGVDCGLTCTQRLAYGSTMTLTARPDERSRFAGWEGACQGMLLSCSLTLTTTQQVTANFALKQYALTVGKTGSGLGQVIAAPAVLDCGEHCTATLDHGRVVTMTAVAATYTHFDGWTGACTGTGPCVLTIDVTKTLTASFTADLIVALSATITTTAAEVSAGEVITYHYQLTNTGDLSVTIQAFSDQLGTPTFTRLVDGARLTATTHLRPGEAAVATQATVAPRCTEELTNTLVITGINSSGLFTTTRIALTTAVNTQPLPPQRATANQIYIGCKIQLALGASAAATAESTYDMVVIVGDAPAELIIEGAQQVLPYQDEFTLTEQSNRLLQEGCAAANCQTVRRMIIEQGKAIQIDIIDQLVQRNRLWTPLILLFR